MELRNGTDPQTAAKLTELRDGLLRLHKILLESEREVYERDVRPIESRGELLTLVLNDPWFHWLHEVSRLVVDIDEGVDGKLPVSEEACNEFIRKARALLVPVQDGVGFGKRYDDAMQRDPDVVLAHGAMMRTLASLQK